YAWTAPAGVTITSGQGTNSVTVSVAPGFNIGNLCVTGTSNCGVTSAARCKTVSSTLPVTPGNISGISNGVCNSTVTYSVPAVSGVTAYNWTAPSGATIVSGQGTNTVEVSYPNGFNNGQLCVTAQNGCGTSSARCINVKGVPASPGVISGPITVCTGEQGLNYSIATMFGASNYTWVVPTGTTIIAGQGTPSIFVDWGTTGGLVTVTATNSCGVSGTRTLNVIVNCKLSGNEIPGVKVNAYPNPVASELTIEVTAETSNTYALEMTDVSGRVVYTGQMNTTGGMKTTTVDVSKLSKGMYMLTVRSNDGFSNQIRIAVQ
ncbi:MAG: T9SS type A sorting domain-containing protein, partial [Bacteroidia bacterium]|nr:T9SS type A sorting domain-containing protein [Bacteroidia bacterium]